MSFPEVTHVPGHRARGSSVHPYRVGVQSEPECSSRFYSISIEPRRKGACGVRGAAGSALSFSHSFTMCTPSSSTVTDPSARGVRRSRGASPTLAHTADDARHAARARRRTRLLSQLPRRPGPVPPPLLLTMWENVDEIAATVYVEC